MSANKVREVLRQPDGSAVVVFENGSQDRLTADEYRFLGPRPGVLFSRHFGVINVVAPVDEIGAPGVWALGDDGEVLP